MSKNVTEIRLSNENKKLKTKLVLERASRIKLYDDVYPDVGMGMNWDMCVYQALKELGYKKEDIDYDSLI